MFDARLLVGPAMLALGLGFVFLSVRLWAVRPLNRVFRLGPFVTEKGMVAILNLRFTSFAFGAFFVVQGLTAIIFWYGTQDIRNPLVQALGSLGAGLGLWAVFLMYRGLWRVWRTK
ncbi:hypothetical protein D9601_02365 [Sphingomonas sp. MA1305]|uniref:hypothetical protein n=1 Tax=Sphingomonas sp. MA1305 TaxID=2479204 RepID=UPI0018DFCB3E|nr:hypothetical protein [Sphingomonas sp. MA1305]MBI0474209.1 hypothetical protein [Sphingomonas sp. MA1305]